MTNPTRRNFMNVTGIALGSALLPNPSQAKKDSVSSRFTIALSQYSLRAMFRDGSLDPLDFPAFTKDTFGISAIDLWEGGLPSDKLNDNSYLEKMRSRAAETKSELFLLMAGLLDATEDKRKESVASLIPSLDRAQKLGCDFLRIFLRAPGTETKDSIPHCVSALGALADAAAKRDVTVAIEPGASPLSEKGTFLAATMEKLKHPHCRLMPDFGKQKNNVYDGTEAMMPHTVTISAKMHSFDEKGNQPHFDYVRLMKIIAASKYRGFLAIEWEGSRLKPIEGVKASQRLIKKSLAAV